MTAADDEATRALAAELADDGDDPPLRRRKGTVTAVVAGLVTVRLGAAATPTPRFRTLVPVVVGDTVEVVKDGPTMFVVGHLMDTAWHQVGASGEPAFANNWTHYQSGASGYGVVRFRKIAGIVRLEGLAAGGASGTTMFTLPSGYRPAQQLVFATWAGAGVARVDVAAAGEVSLAQLAATGDTNYVSLSPIAFPAEQ